MEKKNNSNSALKKTADILRRNTKSRLAIQKFLNDLQEQESEYLNENKQITQCVFLGALCLKPVPADIFEVTLQPISFTTHSKSGVLYNNTVKKDTNSVVHGPMKSENTKKIKVTKTPRKNSKTSTIETNVFIGNICEQKPGNRILELFNKRHLSATERVHSVSSKVKLNGKNKNDKKIKYKIKVGGILRKNKKDLSEQKQEELHLKSDNQTFHKSHSTSSNTQIEIPKIKSSLRHKFLHPKTREVRQCKVQIENINSKVNNTISPLFVEGSKSFKRSTTDNTIERLKKKRGIEIKKITKMETKSKTIPSLVSVKSIISGNGPSWNFIDKTETGHPSSILNSFNGSNKVEQRISFVKEGSIDLLEIIDDEIEDYLEIDQNIVADLEALIPEEEIESISNTLISSTKIPNTASNNSVNKSFVTVNNSLNESKMKQLDKILLVNTSKSIEMVEDNDFKRDIEISESVDTDSLDNKSIREISVLGSSTKRLLKNDLSDEHSKVSKRKSDNILAIANKKKGNKLLGIECEESKHSKRLKLLQSSPRKLTAKFKKHSNEPKINISKKIKKITDFLFPIEKTDDNIIENFNFENVSQKHKNSDEEDSKNRTVVFLNKTIGNVSSDLNKASFGEMRTLRSCSKKSHRDDITNIKTIGLTTVKDTKGAMLSPENEVVFICKNDENTEKKQKIITDNEGFSLYETNVIQSDENISKISPVLSKTKTDISDLSIQNPITEGTVEIRNLKNKTVKNCKPKKKKSIESKKINVSKIERTIDVVDKLQSEEKIDSDMKLGTDDFPKEVGVLFNSNEDHDKAQKPNILHTKPIFKDIKEVHSKLENYFKKRRKEVFNKNSRSPEGELTTYKNTTKSEVTPCDKSEVIAEKTVQAMKILSEDNIESDANVVVEQCHPNEHANMNNPISKTRSRREIAARTQKIDGVTDIHKDTASTIREANIKKADAEVIDKPSSLVNGKSMYNTFDSINLNSLPQSIEEPSDDILKVNKNTKITNCGNFKSVNSNQLGKPNSWNDVQDNIPLCKEEFAAIPNYNETILQVEPSQETAVAKAVLKPRFQLRRKKTEVPNENIELKKPKHFEHSTHPIEHENFTNQFIVLKNQSALSNINNGCEIVENNPDIFDIKEDNLKTNVFRNTRRNKIGNENSNKISLKQSDKKVHFKEKELKKDIKQLCRLKVKGNEIIANNKTTCLRKKIQQETLKNIKIRNQIKGGRVLKRITNLRKGCRQKIVEQNNSIEKLSKSDENITGVSNKKGNKVIKPTSIEMQSSAVVNKNEEKSLGKKSTIIHESTSENSINEQIFCNTIKTSDSENSHSKVASIVKHNNKIENISNNDKKYTFRNRKSISGRKAILSKIHNVVNNLIKPKTISKSKHSLDSMLNNGSRKKSNHKHQLNENKIQVTSTNVIVNKVFMKEDILELSGEYCSPQGFLNESEINKRKSGENELHSSTNIMSPQNLASSVEEKLTEIQSDTVEEVISKPRTKKASTKSLNSKSQSDVRTVKQKNKLEEFLTDTSLHALSKPKNQPDKEKIGSINEDELLNTEKKSDILHEEKSKQDILKKFNEEKEIACYNDCGISHKNNERKEKINNQLVKETFHDVQSTSPENKNLSFKNVSQKREHGKSSDSVVHKVGDMNLGILQEKMNLDHSGFCGKEFQHKAENILSPSEDKNHSKAELPVTIVLSGVSKIKSKQKPTSKRLPVAITKSENKGKLRAQKDEKSDTINAVVDTSCEIVAFSDQKLHTFATENIKNATSKMTSKEISAVEVEAPVVQTQKNLDLFNIFENSGTMISPDGSSLVDIAQKKLQFINKNTSITLDKTLNESQLHQQNEKDGSRNSVHTTRNVQECEHFEKIFIEGVTSESRNDRVIPPEEPIEQNNVLQHPESHSSNAKKTVVEDSLEPTKRRYRKSKPKDQKINIRQVTRKRKNNMVKECNDNPKIEAGVLKPAEADKTGLENNSNFPFVLKEDLSNANSELSQEIERRMQIEFNREFPNYGPSAPERYRRIYRCRICLLVCETYGKLKLHRRIHDVATPYQCQQCDNSYDDVEDLAAHLRIHKGEKLSQSINIYSLLILKALVYVIKEYKMKKGIP